MKWEIDSKIAIYPQIVDGFIRAIISKELTLGQKLPSVRDLASEAAINPNTMQRALAELERRELIVNMGTVGKCVTEDIQLIDSVKKEYASKHIKEFIATMTDMGFTIDEIAQAIKEAN